MKLFKFNWFSSKEREELEALRKEVEVLRAKEKDKKEKVQELPDELLLAHKVMEESLVQKKPYRSLRIIGSTLIVILWDGTPVQGDAILADKVRAASSESDVINIMNPKVQEEIKKSAPDKETEEERDTIRNNWRVLVDHEDFEIINNEPYMKGIALQLPAIVSASFIEILEKTEKAYDDLDEVDKYGKDADQLENLIDELEEQYEALKMFWMKLAVNPIEQSRNQLLTFVKKNDVRITSTGNLVLYRNIVTIAGTGNVELIAFISQQYTKVKKWKKSPKNFFIEEITESTREETKLEGYYEAAHEDDEEFEESWVEGETLIKSVEKKVLKLAKLGDASTGTIIGNLEKLYLDLPNMQENQYTSWNNKGKYIIKIGEVYKEDIAMLNTDAGLCSAGGLHAAAVDWDYSGFGDTPVVVLVNPSKALTVPYYDSGKLRTTEMFVMCINDKPIGEHFDDFLIYDDQYNEYSINELETAVKSKDFSTLTFEDKAPKVDEKSLEFIAEQLRNRVVKVS